MNRKHNLIKLIGVIYIILLLVFLNEPTYAQAAGPPSALEWYSDFEQAKQLAEPAGKYVLLYFSGSDWCKPCIQLNENILTTETFSEYAKGIFVPVKLDFPKMRKNRLSKKKTTYNEDLAEKYNPNGVFPLLVFLDNNDKMIGFTGYTDVSPRTYVGMIERILN